MTPLTKPVRRLSNVTVRDGAVVRKLVVTIYPSGNIGLRPEGTRREELYPLDYVYSTAVKARVKGG